MVWDLGNVLVDWSVEHLYRPLIPNPDERSWFLSTVLRPQDNHRMDLGEPVAAVLAEREAAFPEHRELIRAFWDRWPDTLNGLLAGSVDVLARSAAAGNRNLVLSNFSAETLDRAEVLAPVWEHIEGRVISGDLGVAKPDPEIYRTLLRRFRVDPSAAVFIDDKAENVAAATSLGLAGVVFEDSVALVGALGALGVAL